MTAPPVRAATTQQETGRSCPYCRFPLKEGVEMVSCGSCHAAHHADCWDDNAGCAVVACPGGPSKDATRVQSPAPAARPQIPAQQPVAATAPQPQEAMPTAAWPPPPRPPAQQSPRERSNGPWLAIAVILLAVAIGGAAFAVVSQQSSSPDPQQAAATTPPAETVTVAGEPASSTSNESSSSGDETTTDDTVAPSEFEQPGDITSSEPTDSPTSPSAGGGALPNESRSAMESDITDMLRSHHEDIVNGDYSDAFGLLSARKQSQSERKFGYSGWAANQATLGKYLDPSGISVSIDDLDRSTGVARVDVEGMGWSDPSSSCSTWSGITWAKYEDGAWKYDPGYSTTPQRERDWKARFSELLGGTC